MRTITIDLCEADSIKNAISEIQDLKAEWKRKANVCSEMIAAMLAAQIEANLDAIPYTDDIINLNDHVPTPKSTGFGVMPHGNSVIVRGMEVAFVEFGAGIYHNSSGETNPLSEAVQFSTDIGSYGKGQGLNNYWFIAHNRISRGTPMYMPIHRAILAIQGQIPTLVRQVFV